MVLLRSEKDSRMVQPGLQVLRDAGVSFKEISALDTRKLEPAINPDTNFFGSIHLPDDEVGNCRQFALLLKGEAQKMGVNFEFNKAVAQLNRARPASVLIADETQARQFDSVVLCAGLDSVKLLNPLGMKL